MSNDREGPDDVWARLEASYRQCIACSADTGAGFWVWGDAEYQIATLHSAAGLTLADAADEFAFMAEHELGCDPGELPEGRITVGYLLCFDCAAKTGAVVDDRPTRGPVVPDYAQPWGFGA